MTEHLTALRPAAVQAGGPARPATPQAREQRLKTLYERWNQFAGEYRAARERNDQEVMTNLRGLMLLIKKEIVRLGGQAPEFPAVNDEHLIADL
jgi:hypothetical protein